MDIHMAIQQIEYRLDYEGDETATEAWNTIRTFVAKSLTKRTECPLCNAWKGAKRYTYCPDCGLKLNH